MRPTPEFGVTTTTTPAATSPAGENLAVAGFEFNGEIRDQWDLTRRPFDKTLQLWW